MIIPPLKNTDKKIDTRYCVGIDLFGFIFF